MMNKTDEIIRKELRHIKNENIFLQHGAMGHCIFWFWYARKTGNVEYEKDAMLNLETVYESVSTKSFLEINNGLAGIGLGICYLIENNYIEGEPDRLLKDIDDHIYRTVICGIDNNKNNIASYENTLLDVMLYISFRLKASIKKANEKIVMQHFLILMLDKLYQNHSLSFYEEPLPASTSYKLAKFMFVLTEIHKLNIYNHRIERILNEMKINLFSRIPICHSNRLYLFCALNELTCEIRLDDSWNTYIDFLRKNISIPIIVNQEIRSNNMFITKGLSGIYLMLKFCNRKQVLIPYSLEDIFNRLMGSTIWKLVESPSDYNDSLSGLDGFTGLIMILDDIENKLASYEKI